MIEGDAEESLRSAVEPAPDLILLDLTIADIPAAGEAGSPAHVSLFGCARHLEEGDGSAGISGI